jgi:uncharacterized protein YukE
VTRAPSGAERIEEMLGPAGAAYTIIKPIVEFLANPLDSVTGDPDELREKAEAWRSAAQRLLADADTELAERARMLAYWEGDASAAFDQEMAQINDSLAAIAEHFDVTAQLLDGSAEGAQQAQELVEQIARELIAWLIVTIIVALASAWITAGASIAVGAAAGAAESAVAAGRAVQVAGKLAALLRKVQAFLKKMSEFAKAYKLTKIHKVGVQNWAGARFATQSGFQLMATNWVIKKTIVEPVAGPTIDKVSGADATWKLPQVL